MDGRGSIPETLASGPAVGRTQPPIQWVPGALSLGVNAAGAWCWSAERNARYISHKPISHFFETHFNIVLPPTSSSPKICLPFRSSDQKFVRISQPPTSFYTPHKTSSVDLTTTVTSAEKRKLWCIPVLKYAESECWRRQILYSVNMCSSVT
jgi:hypothetical protein